MVRAVVLTQYRRVTDRRTDGQTDGIAVANTALAMRALRARLRLRVLLRLLLLRFNGRFPGEAGLAGYPSLFLTKKRKMYLIPLKRCIFKN